MSSLFNLSNPLSTQGGQQLQKDPAPSMFAPGGLQFNQSQNPNQNQNQNQGQNGSSNLNPLSTLGSSFGPQQSSNNNNTSRIDLDHLRPTTKYDQLTQQLQTEIANADEEISAQIKQAEELEVLLPNVRNLGAGLKPQVELVDSKLKEVQEGFERDAVEIVDIREGIVKSDEGEAKMCWREVERLKAPGQYQYRGQGGGVGTGTGAGAGQPGSSVYGGLGMSGWWNHPQTLRGSVRGGGASGQAIQVLDEDDDSKAASPPDPKTKPPANLIDLFNRRADDMHDALEQNKSTLEGIEAYIESLEDKIRGREREVRERMDYGVLNGGVVGEEGGRGAERAQQVRMLKYVFGEAERSLYEVAGKIGEVRDRVVAVQQADGVGML